MEDAGGAATQGMSNMQATFSLRICSRKIFPFSFFLIVARVCVTRRKGSQKKMTSIEEKPKFIQIRRFVSFMERVKKQWIPPLVEWKK